MQCICVSLTALMSNLKHVGNHNFTSRNYAKWLQTYWFVAEKQRDAGDNNSMQYLLCNIYFRTLFNELQTLCMSCHACYTCSCKLTSRSRSVMHVCDFLRRAQRGYLELEAVRFTERSAS